MPAPRRPRSLGPPLPTHQEPGGQILDVGPAVRVACFGDSLMWGQGLNHDEKFKTWVTRFGLRNELNAVAGIVYDRSRAGAKIIGSIKGRQEFVDTYPELFPNGAGLDAFKANDKAADGVGRNESPATALYGEIPSTYPTVGAQVDLLSPTNGKTIDYALVTGGINDIGPEDIINPQIHDGTYIENYDKAIFDIGYTQVLALLQRVRAKCPKAVIFYFGFYPGLSYDSTTSKIRDYFEYENNDDFKWWLTSTSTRRPTSTASSTRRRTVRCGSTAAGSTGRARRSPPPTTPRWAAAPASSMYRRGSPRTTPPTPASHTCGRTTTRRPTRREPPGLPRFRATTSTRRWCPWLRSSSWISRRPRLPLSKPRSRARCRSRRPCVPTAPTATGRDLS